LLRLKRLELQGFKSFCDRTEVRFNGNGIVAIVGPNGCGKSNLSDAISWVLGEQSAKSLRGVRMEDVIFAGTRERKPLGMASVTMTLVDPEAKDETAGTNGDGRAPGEIVITRRLFRSGESEYLINGRPARLRDIQDIFMGTGLGPDCYTIIEQGRINQILSSRPQERRALIEEAAGVTKFKARRRLAEAKLEGAKQNLSRVFDILEEVGRQVNSLKRQASKARRYEELRAELSRHLERVLAGRYTTLERTAAKAALDLKQAGVTVAEAATAVEAQEAEHARIQAESYQKENELTAARRALADLQLEAERTRGRLAGQTQQIASIDQRLAQAEAEKSDLERRAAAFAEELAGYAGRIEELGRELEAAGARLSEKNRERERLEQELSERERRMESCRQLGLRLMGEASALRNQLAQINEYLASLDRDAARAQKEEQTAAQDLEWLAASRNELVQRAAEHRREFDSITAERKQTETALAERRRQAAEARRRLDVLRADFSGIKARRDSLEEILSHRAYTAEAVRRLFAVIESRNSDALKPAGVLADFVEVDPAHEKAVEEFLHDELEYVVVGSWEEAEAGINLLRSELDGRATFLVHPNPDANLGGSMSDAPPIGPETGIVARLSDLVRLTNGLTHAPAELVPRLARCFLAEDRAAARRLAVRYPQFYFLAPDGVCYSGYAATGGRKTGSGPLALKRELRELASAVRAREQEIAETAERLETLEKEIVELESGLERLRAAEQSREKELLALEHERRKLEEEFAKASSRLSIARLELERLSEERKRSVARREQVENGVREKEQAAQAEQTSLDATRGEVENLRSQAARLAEEHAALRAGLAGLEERHRSEQAARRRLETQLSEVVRRQKELAMESEKLTAERARLAADNVVLENRIAELAGKIAEMDEAVARLSAEETSRRKQLAAVEEQVKELRRAMQEAEQQRGRIELELVKLQAEIRVLDETSRRELSRPVAELATSDETVPDEIELAELEQRAEEVRARIEALGPVNPQAWEEYQEAQRRYDFLNAQRQDLLDSIRDTEKAIQEIDAETRRRFSEAFQAINENFREMFRTLFGGGTGEMRLTDEANAAESGIEIVASPPGKRLQNVLLLSGGEKALTALALLMGIFKYRPSPFCIFDEVDAPLDEPNIERMNRLLKEMSSQTQFILITHARRTMEIAEALYGVTMQEPGVSTLVSVNLGRARAAAPPPPPAEPAAQALPA